MTRHDRLHSLLGVLAGGALLILSAGSTLAQVKDPKFDYGKYEEAKAVEWKASAKVGFVLATGNAQSASAGLAGQVSRKAHGNKFALEGGWTYARSRLLQAVDGHATGVPNGFIEPWEMVRSDEEIANAWNVKGRYDRFFTEHNAAYIAALVSGDTPAGKEVLGGGQIGYSRQLFKSPRHEALVEIGYDFSYENYVTPATLPNGRVDDAVAIHSMRLFAGYTLKITDSAGLFANLESLFNLSTEDVLVAGGGSEAGPFRDTRLNLKSGLSATIWKKLSLSVSFGLRFDNVPAPLPAFKAAPYVAGFSPLANKTDTSTEAALIYSFF